MAVLSLDQSAEVQGMDRSNPTTSPMTMNVFVRWNEGKTLCLQVDREISVSNLALSIWEHAHKRMVVDKQSSSMTLSRDFCMSCKGKVLDAEDDRALWQVVGAKQTTVDIQVWTRQRGGCFMVSCSILGIIMMAIVGSTCTCGLSLFIVPLLLPLLFVLPLFCL